MKRTQNKTWNWFNSSVLDYLITNTPLIISIDLVHRVSRKDPHLL